MQNRMRGDKHQGSGAHRLGNRTEPWPAGLAARQEAVRLIEAVLARGRALDDALTDRSAAHAALDARDRAFARAIATTVLRRLGELDALLARFIEKPLPERQGRLRFILLSAAAQLAFLETPPHAAISLAVDQCRMDRDALRFDKLANAVLRRTAEQGSAILASLDPVRLNIPDWQFQRWTSAYGEGPARRIAEGSLREAALDITVKGENVAWAERLGGIVLPTGSIRVASHHGRIDALPGFADGAWWVQDAAAALPARLFGDVRGLRVADLCAAPGGKTAELAAAGAHVTAVEQSAERVKRLEENLARLRLAVDVVKADAATWQPGEPFDAVLLDAPCTATGTIRRHPDILRLKRAADLDALTRQQATLIDNAARLVKPGGLLVYCVCSLEPEEGAAQIATLLGRNATLKREPLRTGEGGISAEWISPDGDLRTLPSHAFGETSDPRYAGMDGFFAARLRRKA